MNTDVDEMLGGSPLPVAEILHTGGKEIVVGESARWFMQDKLLKYKYANGGKLCKGNKTRMKCLLNIIGTSIPISFNTKVFYDDSKATPPGTVDTKGSKADVFKSKTIKMLKKRREQSAKKVCAHLMNEYNIRAPLFWVLMDMIKYMAVKLRKKNPKMRKIKISPNMAEIMDDVWKGSKHFQYHVNSSDIPKDTMALMLHMLGLMRRVKKSRGKWREPDLVSLEVPVMSPETVAEIDKLKKVSVGSVEEYVLSILKIEAALGDHIDALEKYFIAVAKNMNLILVSVKAFFKK
jgi:hypothetical protein